MKIFDFHTHPGYDYHDEERGYVTTPPVFADGLKKMGVKDVFKDSDADFSVLTDLEPVWLEKVQHAARVVIDEEGCTAAAYTAMLLLGSAAPPDEEVDFVLDRPFLFVLTGIDNLPLFVGVVNQPV